MGVQPLEDVLKGSVTTGFRSNFLVEWGKEVRSIEVRCLQAWPRAAVVQVDTLFVVERLVERHQ